MLNKYFFFLLASVIISSFSQIILKKSASEKHISLIREYLNPWVITGYAMMLLATVASVIAYSGIEYKNGPVIESTGYILVMLLSFLFFGEPVTFRKALGNILIVIGIIVFYL